jgi:predicted alpha/beta-hydrolase family hydrolase
MYTWNTLTIAGYEHKPVPNTFRRQQDETSHAAIVLPGLGYTAQMPLLFYISQMLLAQGADVLQVNYNYIDAFRGLDSTTQHQWLFADSEAAHSALVAQRSYTHLTIVGKSLGTLAMAHLFTTQTFPAHTDALWLTPVLTNAAVREQIAAFAGPSLVVIGTADSFYDPGLLATIGETSTRRFAIIEGADHGMNVGSDVIQSIQALETTMRTILAFFDSHLN